MREVEIEVEVEPKPAEAAAINHAAEPARRSPEPAKKRNLLKENLQKAQKPEESAPAPTVAGSMPEAGTGTGTESAPETGIVTETGTVTEPEGVPQVEMLDWPGFQAECELMTEQRQEGAGHREILETIRRAREHITVDPETLTPEQIHERDRMYLHRLESTAMEEKPDEAHCSERRPARDAIAKATGVPPTRNPVILSQEIQP